MTDTAAETRTVVVERDMPYPPEKLWRALTQPHLIEEWLMKNDFKPDVGHRFKLHGEWGGVLDCEVLAIEPNRSLTYTWNFTNDDAAFALQSVVTFTLTPSPDRHTPPHGAGRLPSRPEAGLWWRPCRLETVLHEAGRTGGAVGVNVMAKTASKRPTKASAKRTAAAPALLSGGNPQIAKGDGDMPVQAYIAAMPDWKRGIGRKIDELVMATVPGVRKAVKWNSPFYGAPDQDGWFLSLHCFTKYVKVTFFRGMSLHPPPPGKSKHPEVRYLDIREGEFDEKQFTAWVEQARQLPGERF